MARTVKRKEPHRPWLSPEEDVERSIQDYLKVSQQYGSIPFEAYEIAEEKAWQELLAARERND